LYEDPWFFEDAEMRRRTREQPLFDAFSRGPMAGHTVIYLIRQRHRIRVEDLPERCALDLSLPVPRQIDGAQRVRLIGCRPAELARHLLPTAGHIHDIRVLVGCGQEVPPFELEFEVEQTWTGLRNLHDNLRGSRPLTEGIAPHVLREWEALIESRTGPDAGAHELIEALLDCLEETFQFGITGPPRPSLLELLPQIGVGDIHALSEFAVAVLRHLGLYARLGAGQALDFADDATPTHLGLHGSPGYDHRFVYWQDGTAPLGGTFDLSYLRRWHFAMTEENTRSPEARAQLEEMGAVGRDLLRRGAYPCDMILSGCPRFGRIVNLRSEVAQNEIPPIDTQIVAEVLERPETP
jgi:hypothetical protein